MQINPDNGIPIFMQVASAIEDAILTGAFKEEEQIPSITEFSVTYKINPATALKGITQLVDQNILYKKRGVGMFVTKEALSIVKEKHKNDLLLKMVQELCEEAKKLDISLDEIKEMLDRGFNK